MDIGLKITIKLQLDHQLLLLVLTCSVVSNSLQPGGLWITRLLYPWDFPGKNTGMGCYFPCQGIFPSRGKTVAVVSPTFFMTSVTWEALTSLELLNESSSVNHSALMGKSKCLNMVSGADLQLSPSLTSIQPAWLFSSSNVTSYFFFFLPCGMWGPSSPTKDQTHAS